MRLQSSLVFSLLDWLNGAWSFLSFVSIDNEVTNWGLLVWFSKSLCEHILRQQFLCKGPSENIWMLGIVTTSIWQNSDKNNSRTPKLLSLVIHGGFQLLDLIIPELKCHVIPYKFKSSHWLKLQHSDWRANLVKDFFYKWIFHQWEHLNL